MEFVAASYFFSHLSPILYWCFRLHRGFQQYCAVFFFALGLLKRKKASLTPFLYVHLLISVAIVYHLCGYDSNGMLFRQWGRKKGYCVTSGREYNYFVK